MISIRSYLQADRQTENALLQLVQVLLDGIERHSIEGAPEELANLKGTTRRVIEALEAHESPDEPLARAALAMDTLKQHNERAVEYLRRPVAELQAKIKLLTAAITSVSSASSENIQRLEKIKSQMLSSVEVKDIRSLRKLLSDCLDGVLAEAERQRAQSDQAAEELHRSFPRANPNMTGGEASSLDPVTGFPTRAAAEEIIAQACQDEAPAFIVVMVINQLETVNRSFGRHVGDAILQRFGTFMRQQLPAVDQLFRWGGPTVVAVVRRKKALDVRTAVEPLLVQRLTVKTGTPDVQVPISARWTVLPLMASPRLLFHKMDSFAQCD